MLILAVIVVLLFLSGYALSRRGTPYNTLLVTVHKLGALGSVVLLAVALITGLATTTTEWPVWALAAVTAASVVSVLASGAVLSASRSPAPVWGRIHRVAPYIVVAAGLATILLTGGNPG